MSSDEMLYICFDTNLLYNSAKNGCDFSKFKMNSLFLSFEKIIERDKLKDSVKIILPSIIIKELKKQQIDNYHSKLQAITKELENFKNIRDFQIVLPQIDYIKLIEEEITKLSNKEYLQIIEIPTNEKVFKKIINRAIDKQPPFCGNDSASDKGFKDVLIWETLINYANDNPGRYLFCSKNKKDFPKDLHTEFFNRTYSIIEIFHNDEDLLNKLLKYTNTKQKSKYDFIINELDHGDYLDNLYIEIKDNYKSLTCKNELDTIQYYETNEYKLISSRTNLIEIDEDTFQFDMILEALLINNEEQAINKTIRFTIEVKYFDEQIHCKIIEYSME